MAKSVCVRVFMTPERYMELVSEAKANKIVFRSDSELIHRLLDKFMNPILRIERNRLQDGITEMKQELVKNDSVIETLRSEIADLKKRKVKK